jgi:peptidase M28-like protein
MYKTTCHAIVVAAVLFLALVVALVGLNRPHLIAAESKEHLSPFRLEDIPFDGRAAYTHLRQICAFGPRPSGSAGMVAQQRFVADHFRRLGARVSFQEFRTPNPRDGVDVPMANMIVEWHPDHTERILLCTHYDTRPYPDRDRRNPGGVHIGANNGASGVAVLMELGKWMPRLESKYGVDFVLFDGSQFVFKEGNWRKPGDRQLLGSEYFAKNYVSNPPPFKYRWGVMLNMVAGDSLQVYEEHNSMSWRDTRPLVDDIWRNAYKLGVREFIPTRQDAVSDDHMKLNEIAKIPTCEIIDFDDPYYRTEQDTPQACSALSLAKVGWVLLDWLPKAK